MSARFGRNKRRRAREAISALQQRETDLLSTVEVERNRSLEASRDAASLREEIRLAKAIAGPHSILFKAKDREHHSLNAGGSIEVDLVREFDLRPISIGSMHEMMSFESVRLDTLVASVDKDWLRRSIHVQLTFDERRVAYAVDDLTLRYVPPAELPSFLAREISPLLAEELADALGRRRRA